MSVEYTTAEMMDQLAAAVGRPNQHEVKQTNETPPVKSTENGDEKSQPIGPTQQDYDALAVAVGRPNQHEVKQTNETPPVKSTENGDEKSQPIGPTQQDYDALAVAVVPFKKNLK